MESLLKIIRSLFLVFVIISVLLIVIIFIMIQHDTTDMDHVWNIEDRELRSAYYIDTNCCIAAFIEYRDKKVPIQCSIGKGHYDGSMELKTYVDTILVDDIKWFEHNNQIHLNFGVLNLAHWQYFILSNGTPKFYTDSASFCNALTEFNIKIPNNKPTLYETKKKLKHEAVRYDLLRDKCSQKL